MIKLHLGCGDKILDGYINIDSRKLPGVDIVDDISNINTFENETIDVIYCSHVLEHFGRHEYMNVLHRWYDILKPGGILRISVPDFEMVAEHYIKYGNIDKILGFLYGGQNYKENYHLCTWDFNKLRNDLILIGFKDVKRYGWQNTEHSHIDDYSQSYLPHLDKENGMLMSLNVEGIK